MTTTPIPVAVVGAAGYSGAELVTLLASHPDAVIVGLYSEDVDRFGGLTDVVTEAANAEGIDLFRLFHCTPAAWRTVVPAPVGSAAASSGFSAGLLAPSGLG